MLPFSPPTGRSDTEFARELQRQEEEEARVREERRREAEAAQAPESAGPWPVSATSPIGPVPERPAWPWMDRASAVGRAPTSTASWSRKHQGA